MRSDHGHGKEEQRGLPLWGGRWFIILGQRRLPGGGVLLCSTLAIPCFAGTLLVRATLRNVLI